MRESELYAPVKAHLEAQGYEVKAEIGDCDMLARRGQEPPVVVELKLTFSLALVMQGVARQTLFEHVYLAVPVSGAKGWKLRYSDIIRLCRRLGLGLLAVRTGAGERVEAHLDPAPYAPRRNIRKAGRLIREFDRREGDPNIGGTTGVKRVTAYRQDAVRIAACLADGPCKVSRIAGQTGIARTGTILRADHYGWFERVERGIYALTPRGRRELKAPRAGGESAGAAPALPGRRSSASP